MNMGVAVYLSFSLFNFLVFPSLFWKLKKQDTNSKGFGYGSLPHLFLIILWCILLRLAALDDLLFERTGINMLSVQTWKKKKGSDYHASGISEQIYSWIT